MSIVNDMTVTGRFDHSKPNMANNSPKDREAAEIRKSFMKGLNALIQTTYPDLKQCVCIKEPRGQNGLEGFQLNDIYYFQRLDKYVRVFPGTEIDYYETCGPNVFRRYFRETK